MLKVQVLLHLKDQELIIKIFLLPLLVPLLKRIMLKIKNYKDSKNINRKKLIELILPKWKILKIIKLKFINKIKLMFKN
jgi:ABC-type transport system involved in cytochrome c biogenesis permease component